jgi:signal peptidase I
MWLKKKIRKIIIVLVIFLLIIVFRLFLFDVYKVPSASMEPSLLPGDYVIVSKMSYGPRIINIPKLIFNRKLEYFWMKGIGDIKKGDVIVFNLPEYEYIADAEVSTYGACLIKRCLNLPGDSVRIRTSERSLSWDSSTRLFPHDSALHWTIENYGPLFVPGKGTKIILSLQNVGQFKDMLSYEGVYLRIRNDSVFLNGKYAWDYTFKYNYYFMLGDNFYNSNDSRYWGLVPKTHIIGKAVLVLFSLDPKTPWYKKFRWGRLLRIIK